MLGRLLRHLLRPDRKSPSAVAPAASPLPDADEARRMFAEGRFDQAGRLLERLHATGRGSPAALAALKHSLAPFVDQERTSPDALVFLGNIRRLELAPAAAESSYRRALEIDPTHFAALSNLSLVLRDRGEHEESQSLCERALAIDPSNADLMLNAAAFLLERGRHDEGMQLLGRIRTMRPDSAHADLLESVWLLKHGSFAEGWDKYESRAEALGDSSPYPYPAWSGDTSATGILLIRAEQGLGDQIMFASCIPDAMRRAPRCIVECDHRLKPIFARSFPDAAIYGYRTTATEAWLNDGRTPASQIAIGSLPRLFRRSRADFPVHQGYLRADPRKVDDWRRRLSDLGPGPKVGLSWRGGVPGTRQALRSIPLADWGTVLAVPNVRWVSLQYGSVADEVEATARSAGVSIHHWPDVLADQDQVAALIVALDLTLTVQTSVAHMAGALGRKVWVLIPAVPEWRYGAAGETMAWYPSARLWRRSDGEPWENVLARVAHELARNPSLR